MTIESTEIIIIHCYGACSKAESAYGGNCVTVFDPNVSPCIKVTVYPNVLHMSYAMYTYASLLSNSFISLVLMVLQLMSAAETKYGKIVKIKFLQSDFQTCST